MTDPWFADDLVTVYHGDSLDILKELPDASVDAVVTDPPYGLEFMGKDWDRPWAVSPTQGVGFAGREDNLTLPSFGDNRNANCRTCGGRQRGKKRCVCAAPDWDRDPTSDMREFQAWCQLWAAECLRVLKPGGHMLAFGGTRTWHRLACAIEDAGFEIRDSIAWLYGSGFPKSLDVSKAIDKAAGAEREVVAADPYANRRPNGQTGTDALNDMPASTGVITAPATPDAQKWAGWGTALKPAHEPIVVARKPLTGTVAANVLAHGTGALNIDATRIHTAGSEAKSYTVKRMKPGATLEKTGGNWRPEDDTDLPWEAGREYEGETKAGRWPANVVLDPAAAEELDRQSGESSGTARTGPPGGSTFGGGEMRAESGTWFGDSGGASRFFYVAKANSSERPRIAAEGAGDHRSGGNFAGGIRVCNVCQNRTKPGNWVPGDERSWPGCGHDDWEWGTPKETTGQIAHPTVKPVHLMRWLVRLVTPKGGVVLDPFLGSGTTAEACVIEGFRCVGVERESDYLPLIRARLTKPIQPDLFG